MIHPCYRCRYVFHCETSHLSNSITYCLTTVQFQYHCLDNQLCSGNYRTPAAVGLGLKSRDARSSFWIDSGTLGATNTSTGQCQKKPLFDWKSSTPEFRHVIPIRYAPPVVSRHSKQCIIDEIIDRISALSVGSAEKFIDFRSHLLSLALRVDLPPCCWMF